MKRIVPRHDLASASQCPAICVTRVTKHMGLIQLEMLRTISRCMVLVQNRTVKHLWMGCKVTAE